MFACGEEILTIAAMTSVQSVFLIAEGAAGAVGELERRKFTAEEGDHLTLLNVYNAFVGVGKSSARWATAHRLNFKALSRAISIRAQLRRYLTRFQIKIQSCEGDQQRLRRCLASGYFRNAAKMEPDGTYRSARDQIVSDRALVGRYRSDAARFFMSIRHLSCSLANLRLAGSYTTKSSKPTKCSCEISLSSTRIGW